MDLKKRKIIQQISENVHQVNINAEVYLFGSRARGDENLDSDWDILILSDKPVSLKDEQKFRHHLIPLELEIGEPLSVFVYYKKEWRTRHRVTPFYQSILKESVKI